MASGTDFCVIQLDGWADWWEETRRFDIQMYISVVLFFLSAVLAYPIARTLFFVVRRFSPKKWIWPDDARSLMMWQTSLLCRAGLLWMALKVSRVSVFLCQWPSWLFGVCFLIWMDALGNVLREVIVRKGLKGYSDDERPGRLTLLYEGTTLAKMLLLMFVIYNYYLVSIFGDDNVLRLVSTTGFFLAIALSLLPLLRNIMGAHYMFISNMLHLHTRVRIQGNAHGSIKDAPLGFLVLETKNKAKTFVPAGGTATSTTTVYENRFRPVRLEIELPPYLSSRVVRAFVQELDHLVSSKEPLRPRTMRRMTAAIAGADDTRNNRDSSARNLFDAHAREVRDTLDRARGRQCVITVMPNKRWSVQVQAFILGERDIDAAEVQALLIEDITELVSRYRDRDEESSI